MDDSIFKTRTFWYKSLWVLVFALAVHAVNMSSSDMRGDAIVYASIAKNIITMHSPLILHFDGNVYLNKPPLFFWLIALSLSVFGYTVFAAKLVAVLAAVALNLSVFYLIVRLFRSYNLGYLCIFCLNTTYVIYKNTHSVRMEGLTAFLILMAIIFLWHYMKSSEFRYLALFGLMSGLAVMSKGFLGFLPWATLLIYLMLPGSAAWRNRKVLVHTLIALLICMVTFGWWYVYISLHTNFFHHFFYGEVAARLLNGSLQTKDHVNYHTKPIYQYVVYMFRDYFMYLPFLIYGGYRVYKEQHRFDREGLVLVTIYTVFSWVVIHAISTRSERYMYEFYTTAALFTAYGIASIPKLKNIRFVNWLKVFGITYMIFILVTPMKLSWNSYTSLRELEDISHNTHIPIYINMKWLPSYVDRAGVRFFLESSVLDQNKPSGSYFTVLPKYYQGNLSYRLIKKTRRVLIVLVPKSDLDLS
ncbi:MAG: Undecaprenyl phosphate-alpha-4-amino-4-deoxy-L-arabinose arabinosyl transferase [Candidatus Celerinatantimonas neptuna]|nr:MAG: Undecaprenyl phosphate-alpha-4-amino-4-deoxy-L-arabinose arabinosyl transferase [Candidatus Celerinatantimonas neptuna]